MTQKDTSKETDARSSYYSRYEREDRCIIQRAHAERTGYGKRFLFLQTPLAQESGGANLSCSYMNAVYIDPCHATEIKRSGKCKGRALARVTLCFEFIERPSDTKTTLKVRYEYELIFL